MRAEIERKGLLSGSVAGTVKSQDGKLVDKPAVIVLKEGIPFIWVIGNAGRYQLDLPVGEYEIYASGKGYSASKHEKVSILATKELALSFDDLLAPARVSLKVKEGLSKAPLDAKIQIEKGNKPLIEFLGAKTFFTELDSKGHVDFNLSPGKYQFKVSSGENFLATASLVNVLVESNKTNKVHAAVDIKATPAQHGWYTGDLHHHADVLEGSTPAEYLVRSQLAAGLSVTFVSDHDSTKNLQQIHDLSAQRDVLFIASIELSPSWGHFNSFPLNLDASLSVDPGVASVDDIFADARKMGAIAIASNHPYIPYGYFSSLEKDSVPGGFNPAIDLIEINSAIKYQKAIEKARLMWSQGLPYYYTAGTDTHDVWNETTGKVRMFVYTGNQPNAKVFAQAMKQGQSYVSFGPIIYPKGVMFGDSLRRCCSNPDSKRSNPRCFTQLGSVFPNWHS